MSFSFLNSAVSYSPIHALTPFVHFHKNKEHLKFPLFLTFESFPYFSLEDQLLSLFNEYYQEYPEEKSLSSYLLQLEIKKFNQDPLSEAVISFLNQKRELGSPLHSSFSFQELLRFINADEVEWIGSSLTEFLAPYFKNLIFKHLLPHDLKKKEIFKTLLSSWLDHLSNQKKLYKKGVDYDLRLVKLKKNRNNESRREQTNQALSFFQTKNASFFSFPLHTFATFLKESLILDKRWAAQANATNYYAMVAFNLKNDKPLVFTILINYTKSYVKKASLCNNCI